MRKLMLWCVGLAVVAGIIHVVSSPGPGGASGPGDAHSPEDVLQLAPAVQSARVSQVQSPETAPQLSRPKADAPIQAGSAPTIPRPEQILAMDAALAKDAEYRKASAAQWRTSVPQEYAGLVEELGLTRQQADQLFDVLAASQSERALANMGAAVNTAAGPAAAENIAAMQELMRVQQELKRRREESLQLLLGDGKYRLFQAYEEQRPARNRAAAVVRALATAGQPLDESQARVLSAALIAEEKRRAEFSRKLVSQRQPGEAVDQLRIDEALLELQAEGNRRIVDAARLQLGVEKLQALEALLDQPLALARAALRVRREQSSAPQQAP